MSTNTEKEKHISDLPELPDTLDIGLPPPEIDILSEAPQAPTLPPVDSIAPIQKVEIAPPPPPPPDYGKKAEIAPISQEIPQQVVEAPPHTEASQKGVAASSTTAAQSTAVSVAPKSEVRKEIEELLSEGLTDIYQTMTPKEQEVFRKKSEETATAIEGLVSTFRATADKVVQLIRAWLKTIPGVNRFFLEQESKLKTDDILKLQMKLKKQERLKRLNIQ